MASAILLASMTTGCTNEKTTRPPASVTTTTSGVAPRATAPNNDGSTPTHELLPPARQPDSQPGGPGPISVMEGSPNGASALSDTTTGPVPHNSSEVQGGTLDSMQNGSTAATTQASPSEVDKKTTARIRRSVNQNSALSYEAKTISVETLNGHVTLRGAVNSARERSILEKEAADIAGPSHVDDELTIK
ncbi:MAG: BON domain-containing protein [Polyangiaceae bacterium]